jgi:pyruvate-formate lyase
MNPETEQLKASNDKVLSRGQRLWNRLLEARKTAPVSQWRAILLTASWKETEGLPIPIRRARAFEKIISEIPIFIDDEQLLAGNYGSWPMAAEWRPEITVEWILERFETGKGRLIIKDEDIPVMKEIAWYWQDKDIFSSYHRYIGKEEEKRLKERDFLGAYLGHTYHPALWALGWCVPDYPKAIRKGLLGILAEIEE